MVISAFLRLAQMCENGFSRSLARMTLEKRSLPGLLNGFDNLNRTSQMLRYGRR